MTGIESMELGGGAGEAGGRSGWSGGGEGEGSSTRAPNCHAIRDTVVLTSMSVDGEAPLCIV